MAKVIHLTKVPTEAEALRGTEEAMHEVVKNGDLLDELLFHEPANIVEATSMGVDAQNARLRALAARVAELVAPHSACGSGCSHCCMQAVSITTWEAKQIGAAIGIEPQPARSRFDVDYQRKQFMGSPCPFLKKGLCSIYDYRPLPCRTHFNMSGYPMVCDVVDHPGQSVPNIDWRNVWKAEMMINFQTSQFADIRDFFPDGKDVVESL